MPKKILITGGSGYLAGRLSQNLKGDFTVSLGVRDPDRLKKQAAFSAMDILHFDISDSSSFLPALKNIDVVIHLAALNFQDCEKNPTRAQHINVDQTACLLDAGIQSGVSSFIYMSTIHVYGSPLQGHLSETTTVQPRSVYAKTHWQAEELVRSAHQKGQIQGLILRLSNAIGAPAHPEVNVWNLVTNDLCLQAVRTQKMRLNSSGVQERDFIPLARLVAAVHDLLSQPEAFRLSDPVLNLGSGHNLSIWQFAQLIQQRYETLFGQRPDLTRPPLVEDDLKGSIPFQFDCSKLERFLKHRDPNRNFDLSQGIDETLKFCKAMESAKR